MRGGPTTVIRGARVPDPDHPDGALVDVALGGSTIAALGAPGTLPGTTVVDAGGRLLLPGFVDAHSHADSRVHDPDVQHALLRQGVTTVVVGQDGLGFAPTLGRAALAWAAEYFQAVNGAAPPGLVHGEVDELLRLAEPLPVRVVPLVPHGLLRYAVVGPEPRPADENEVAAMCAAAGRAFEQGARGLSTGLEYRPGGHADARELTALCAVAARHGLPHVTHMRGYEAAATTALAEVLAIGRAAGVATHVSHLHGPAEQILAVVDAAHDEGLALTFDSYPYRRGCSILAMLVLPGWLPTADRGRTARLLADPAVRRRLREEHLPGLADLWPRVTIASAPEAEETEGRRLVDLAAARDVDPGELALDLLVATGLRIGGVFEQPPTDTAASVRRLARHAAHLAGSDGIYQGSHPHPRGWGTFARYLRRHVLETGDWTWADAVEHLSARASRLLRLPTGRVAPGAPADLVLVDPVAVRDRATYAEPRRLADGVADVWVAGRRVLDGGALTPAPTSPIP